MRQEEIRKDREERDSLKRKRMEEAEEAERKRRKQVHDVDVLLEFLFKKHKTLTLEKAIEEKWAIHEWLVFFEKEMIAAFRNMANIPRDDAIKVGTIFEGLKKKTTMKVTFDADNFAERAAAARKL
ncbi:unnamed protein product [Caenorhabditis nigoni]